MKVLLITAYFKEEKRAIPTSYKLASLLCNAGIDVVVLTSTPISKETYEHHPRLKVYHSKDIFFKDPINNNIMPHLNKDIGRILERERPDVCIVSKYIFWPIFSVPFLKRRKQKVIVITDTYPGMIWFTRSWLVNNAVKLHTHTFGKWFLRMADMVVLTHEELIDATRRLGIRRYEVIHNGMDIDKLSAIRPAKDIQKRKGEICIGYVGRLAQVKGIDTLMAAALKILPAHKNVRFLIIGEGDPSAYPKHPRIEYLGYRKDVLSVMKRCDMLVMPSISEGLPSAVTEALALGVPVIGSDIPGGMRVQIINGSTGLLFRKGNADDLASKIERLVADTQLRKRLGRNAKEHVRKNFNNSTISKQWVALLRKVRG